MASPGIPHCGSPFLCTIWAKSSRQIWKVPPVNSMSSSAAALWAGSSARNGGTSSCAIHAIGQSGGQTVFAKLCVADKLAFVLTPAWLYLPMARLSGELREYMCVAGTRQLGGRFSDFELSLLESSNPLVWLEGLKLYTRRWVEEHRNGGPDGWTVVHSGDPRRGPAKRRVEDGSAGREVSAPERGVVRSPTGGRNRRGFL